MNNIASLLKQNEGIETSLRGRGVELEPLPEGYSENVELVKARNDYLKQMAKNNKPPPVVVSKPVAVVKEMTIESDDDIDLPPEPPKPVYDIITNMEEIKRTFFSKEYETSEALIRAQSGLRFYTAKYKYESDNDGKPAFIAKNLLRGFVQQLDDKRKYLMVCFRCFKSAEEGKYNYPSYWIVNTTASMAELVGEDDFDFTPITDMRVIGDILMGMRKTEDDVETLVGEVYLH